MSAAQLGAEVARLIREKEDALATAHRRLVRIDEMEQRLTRLRALAKALCDALPKCEQWDCKAVAVSRVKVLDYDDYPVSQRDLCVACACNTGPLPHSMTPLPYAPALRVLLAELDGADE